jgi:hypothetical protein
LRKEPGNNTRAVWLLVGNPLIMKQMVRSVPRCRIVRARYDPDRSAVGWCPRLLRYDGELSCPVSKRLGREG